MTETRKCFCDWCKGGTWILWEFDDEVDRCPCCTEGTTDRGDCCDYCEGTGFKK